MPASLPRRARRLAAALAAQRARTEYAHDALEALLQAHGQRDKRAIWYAAARDFWTVFRAASRQGD